MTETVAFHIPRDVLTVRGPDTVEYLQGQLSQDVRAVPVGGSAWSFVLQPQGKVDGWFRLSRIGDDEVVIDIDGGHGPGLRARLERFKLRVDAEIASLDDWSVIAVRGAEADEVDPGDAVVVAPVAFGPMVGVDLLGPGLEVPAGVREGTADEYEFRRVAAGFPAMGAELTEDTIPEAAGVVDRSVSFEKGCFTGQELVARIDSRGGNVPRRLRGVVVTGDGVPPVGAEVRAGDDAVGTVTSVATDPAGGRTVALAYVKRAVELPVGVELAWDGSATRGEVRELPLAPDPERP